MVWLGEVGLGEVRPGPAWRGLLTQRRARWKQRARRCESIARFGVARRALAWQGQAWPAWALQGMGFPRSDCKAADGFSNAERKESTCKQSS